MKRTLVLFSLLAAGCDRNGDPSPYWIDTVSVEPTGSTPLEMKIDSTYTGAAPKCGDAARPAKCIEYETQNPLSGGRIVADQPVTVGGAEIPPQTDLGGEAIWADAGTFPTDLYAMETFFLAFDAAAITFADGATTFTLSWEDEDGAVFGDTIRHEDGALVE